MLINALKAEAKERNMERKSDKLVRLFIAGEVELALREFETCTEEQAVEAMSGAIETLKEIEMSGEWPEGALLTDEDHSDILETLTLMVDPRWPFAGKRNRR